MKDIDFDELDKAVNSLMSNVGKETLPEKTEDDDVRTVTIPSTLDNDGDGIADATPTPEQADTPSDENTSANLEDTAKPAAAPATASVATRRGGRFMDVVHPSSDMKSATAPVKPLSRHGVTIAPSANLGADLAVPTANDTPAAEAPEPVETPAPAPAVSEPEPTDHHSDWPDPIDLHEAKQAAPEPEAEEPVSAEPVETPAPAEPVAPEASEAAEPAPLTSPFLADAKVEKRPLGGAPTTEPAKEAKPDTTLEPKLDDTADTTPEEPAKTAQIGAEVKAEELAQPLPPELQGDLVAIEADPSAAHDTDKTDGEPAKQESSKPEASAPAAAPAASGPASIPQQYKEEPSTGDQESGAIYDTETYHQPLAHPAKKKSGWLWILWIVIILILGAGGGAAVYFLGM